MLGFKDNVKRAATYIKKHPFLVLGTIAAIAAAAALTSGVALVPAVFAIAAKLGFIGASISLIAATYLAHKADIFHKWPLTFPIHFIVGLGLIPLAGVIPIVGVVMSCIAAPLIAGLAVRYLSEALGYLPRCFKSKAKISSEAEPEQPSVGLNSTAKLDARFPAASSISLHSEIKISNPTTATINSSITANMEPEKTPSKSCFRRC